jgi:hypothetical protein
MARKALPESTAQVTRIAAEFYQVGRARPEPHAAAAGTSRASRIATRAPPGRSEGWRILKVAIYYASKLWQTERHNEASTPA